MAKNYDNYGYEYDNKKSGLVRIIVIVVMIIAAIILTLILVSSCSNRSNNNSNNNNSNNNDSNNTNKLNLENMILEGGKEYYQTHSELLPKSIGECSLVDLEDLQNENLVSSNNFSGCNLSTTFLKVCKLENNQLSYIPWITCQDKYSDLEYGNLVEGTLNDIVVNQTYIEFKFLPQVMKKGEQNLGETEEMWKDDIKYDSYKTLGTTKYYRYRDKLFTWNLSKRNYYTSTGDKTSSNDVKEYYPLSPKVGYTGYSNRTTDAYKWYTISGGTKEYYTKNGAPAYSPTPVGEYKLNDPTAYEVVAYSSRKVLSEFKPTLYYGCTTGANGTKVIYSPYKCGTGKNPSYNYTYETFYTCVDATSTSDSIKANKVSGANATCYKYGDWSSYSTSSSAVCNIKDTSICRYKTAYLYKWYKMVNETKKYYPSNSTTSSGEKVYYTSAPVKGAVKDTSTKTTAYKWYSETKSVSSKFTAVAPKGYSSATRTNDYKWTEWSNWSTKNPKVNDGRIRSIETKNKIKLQKIIPASTSGWENLSDTYMYEDELINMFKTKNYNVKTLEDINNNGEIKYLIKMYIRNKKGDM